MKSASRKLAARLQYAHAVGTAGDPALRSQVRACRWTGQPGTQKLLQLYGARLLCVRYRYDEEKQERLVVILEKAIEDVDALSHSPSE